MSEHTSPPWEYDADSGEITVEDDILIAEMANWREGAVIEQRSNGNMIAAAPNMFDVLENMETPNGCLDGWCTYVPIQKPKHNRKCDKFRAAIAKARGET